MSTFASGSQGKFKKASTYFDVTKWTLNRRATLAEVTNANTGGWEDHAKVKAGADLTADCLLDTTSNTTTPEALGLAEGDSFTAASLQLGDSTLEYKDIVFRVETLNITGCDVNGMVMFSLTAKSRGAVPDPTAIA